jgi:hypothetical protein
MTEEDSALSPLLKNSVVLDLASPFVIVGTLRGLDANHYIVDDADVHDLRDTTTTRELYVLDTKRHGVNVNRRRVLVRRSDVVGLSLLSDVIE